MQAPPPTHARIRFQMNDGDVWANDAITGAPYRTYCTLCSAGSACNSTGLTEPDVLCTEGYFCKLGASDSKPYCEAGEGMCTYGVCPAGHFCPTGTSDPEECPPGAYYCCSSLFFFFFNGRQHPFIPRLRSKAEKI